MSSDDVLFTVDQAATCSTAMRTALGLPPEHFPLGRFIAMMANEIGQLRAQGWSDVEIAALMAESTGSVVDAGAIATHVVAR